MHARTGKRVQIRGQGGDERLALAGLHFRDAALMDDHAADKLDAERAHTQHTLGRLADDGERVGQDIVGRLALLQPPAQDVGLLPQLGVAHCGVFAGKRYDLVCGGFYLFDLPVAVCAENLCKQRHLACSSSSIQRDYESLYTVCAEKNSPFCKNVCKSTKDIL